MPGSEKFSAKMQSPGARRGKARPFLKGRQVDPDACAGNPGAAWRHASAARDLLIEYLHLIQDRYNRPLPSPHLAALAHDLRLPMAEAIRDVPPSMRIWDVIDDDTTLPYSPRSRSESATA